MRNSRKVHGLKIKIFSKKVSLFKQMNRRGRKIIILTALNNEVGSIIKTPFFTGECWSSGDYSGRLKRRRQTNF